MPQRNGKRQISLADLQEEAKKTQQVKNRKEITELFSPDAVSHLVKLSLFRCLGHCGKGVPLSQIDVSWGAWDMGLAWRIFRPGDYPPYSGTLGAVDLLMAANAIIRRKASEEDTPRKRNRYLSEIISGIACQQMGIPWVDTVQ